MQRALDQLRQTRRKFNQENPGMLDSLKHKIVRYQKMQAEEAQAEQSSKPVFPNLQLEVSKDVEPVDRRKNLKAVMQFMELSKTSSPEFQERLKEVLLENMRGGHA